MPKYRTISIDRECMIVVPDEKEGDITITELVDNVFYECDPNDSAVLKPSVTDPPNWELTVGDIGIWPSEEIYDSDGDYEHGKWYGKWDMPDDEKETEQ